MEIQSSKSGYKIGAVARITGIGSETLRAWERRYSAVTPTRTDSGDRQYSRNDVAKLLLLKTLVDTGFAIGSIADLSTDELQIKVNSVPNLNPNQVKANLSEDSKSQSNCNVVLMGDGFPLRVIDGLPEINGIEVVGIFEDVDELERNASNIAQPDVVIIEKPTINQQTKSELQKIRNISGAWHVILIYGFSTQELIEQNQSAQTTVVRSSVDVQELARLCIYHSGGSERLPSLGIGSTLHFEQTIPARSFSNKQLTEVSKQSNTIKCECPKHVTDLVRNLVSFEIYSAECENQSPDDAALHAYLHATTAQARSMLEEALSHLIRVEGISINNV